MRNWHVDFCFFALWRLERRFYFADVFLRVHSFGSFEQHSDGTRIEIDDGNIRHCWQQQRDESLC